MQIRMLRAMQFIRSLVASNVQEFRSHISTVSSLLLDGTLRKGSALVGQDAVRTYLASNRIL